MSIRRSIVLLAVAFVLIAALPSAAEAGVRAAPVDGGGLFDLSTLFARVAAWLGDLASTVEQTFVATEGATILSGG